jgi:hypothetical protein
MTTLHADDVHAGDVIDYHGELHHIVRVERRDGWAWPIACDATGWAIALGHQLDVPHHDTESPSPTRRHRGEAVVAEGRQRWLAGLGSIVDTAGQRSSL